MIYEEKIEVAQNGTVFVITDTLDDEEQLLNRHRQSFTPGSDVSDQSQAVIDVCAEVWTQPVVDAYRASLPAPAAPNKSAVLAQFRTLREQVLNRLTGLYIDAQAAEDAPACAAIVAARQGLRAIPQHTSVTSAADGLATKAAIQVLYDQFGDALRAASPSSYVAFVGMGPV